MTKRTFFFLFLLFPFYCFLQVNEKVVSIPHSKQFDISYLLDENDIYSVDQLPYHLFKYHSRKTANFGFFVGTIWVRIKLKETRKEKLILELKNATIDQVHAYQFKKGSLHLIGKKGDLVPQKQGLIRYPQFFVESPSELILKIIYRGGDTSIPILFFDQAQHQRRDYIEQSLYGFYFGILSFCILITGIVALFTKNKVAIYFFGFLFTLLTLQLNMSGFFQVFKWFSIPFINNHLASFFSNVSLLFFLFFISEILNTKKTIPKTRKAITTTKYVLLSVAILSLFPNPHFLTHIHTLTTLIILVFPLFSTFIGLNVIITFKPKGLIAEFVTLGIILLFVFTLIYSLWVLDIIAYSFLTEYSLIFGGTIQIICMTIAVFSNFNSLQKVIIKNYHNLSTMSSFKKETLEKDISQSTIELQSKTSLLKQSKKVITDSIAHAQTIQHRLFPDEQEFMDVFTDCFILYKPKNIVSGDFYWMKNIHLKTDHLNLSKTTVCLGDCTGHGVPGAILSVLGLRELRSLSDYQLSSPSVTLMALKRLFQEVFIDPQKSFSIKDGMDASICCFDLEEQSLIFSGAKQDLILIRNGELKIFKGNRISIDNSINSDTYTQATIKIQKGDCFYMTTDGYADQFGGEFDKKLKLIVLKKMLLKYHLLPMSEQKEIFEKELNEWKGDREQTDDITVLGIRI